MEERLLIIKLAGLADCCDDLKMFKEADAVDAMWMKIAATQLELFPRLNPGGDWNKRQFDKAYVSHVKDLPVNEEHNITEHYFPMEDDDEYGRLYHATTNLPSLMKE